MSVDGWTITKKREENERGVEASKNTISNIIFDYDDEHPPLLLLFVSQGGTKGGRGGAFISRGASPVLLMECSLCFSWSAPFVSQGLHALYICYACDCYYPL